jgi:hypothetical protein
MILHFLLTIKGGGGGGGGGGSSSSSSRTSSCIGSDVSIASLSQR